MGKRSYNQGAEIGDRVAFDSDHGPQIGILVNIVRDVGNAQPFAIIAVDNLSPGILAWVPVIDLQPI